MKQIITKLFILALIISAPSLKAMGHQSFNINKINQQGETLLHRAIRNNNSKTVMILIDHGIDINLHGKKTVAPLYYATIINNIEIVRILLNHGASVTLHEILNLLVNHQIISKEQLSLVYINNGGAQAKNDRQIVETISAILEQALIKVAQQGFPTWFFLLIAAYWELITYDSTRIENFIKEMLTVIKKLQAQSSIPYIKQAYQIMQDDTEKIIALFNAEDEDDADQPPPLEQVTNQSNTQPLPPRIAETSITPIGSISPLTPSSWHEDFLLEPDNQEDWYGSYHL